MESLPNLDHLIQRNPKLCAILVLLVILHLGTHSSVGTHKVGLIDRGLYWEFKSGILDQVILFAALVFLVFIVREELGQASDPPIRAQAILYWIYGSYADAALGDLNEEYTEWFAHCGAVEARRMYNRQMRSIVLHHLIASARENLRSTLGR